MMNMKKWRLLRSKVWEQFFHFWDVYFVETVEAALLAPRGHDIQINATGILGAASWPGNPVRFILWTFIRHHCHLPLWFWWNVLTKKEIIITASSNRDVSGSLYFRLEQRLTLEDWMENYSVRLLNWRGSTSPCGQFQSVLLSFSFAHLCFCLCFLCSLNLPSFIFSFSYFDGQLRFCFV